LDINYSELIIFFFFVILSAFFSSTETAFTAINRIRLKQWFEKEDVKHADKLESLIQSPSKLITAILIGNNFSNVACSALATTIIIDILYQFGLTNLLFVMPIVTISITILLLVFGEITPKALALKQPERYALFSSSFLKPFMIVLTPIIHCFDLFNTLIAKLFNIPENSSQHLTIEELKLMVDISHDDGMIHDDKNKMLTSIFEFSDTIVREIMTPRTDAVCVSSLETVQNTIHLITNEGHSRIPVYEDKLDNIIGFIYAKDLLMVSKDNLTQNIQKFMRKAVFIPEFKPVEDLLQQMKRTKFHIAVVVDEHGGFAGLVTLEDIVEEIIGDIQDEYDSDEKNECIEVDTDLYDVDAKIPIKDLEDIIDVEFPEDDDYDTLGGFVLSLKGSFPSKGEVIDYNNLKITVTDIKKRRIIRLHIKKLPLEPTE
tara:strand:- start:1515 stop:2804 length:1290 start_codon:yes stop_codon:yes gene_type:complete